MTCLHRVDPDANSEPQTACWPCLTEQSTANSMLAMSDCACASSTALSGQRCASASSTSIHVPEVAAEAAALLLVCKPDPPVDTTPLPNTHADTITPLSSTPPLTHRHNKTTQAHNHSVPEVTAEAAALLQSLREGLVLPDVCVAHTAARKLHCLLKVGLGDGRDLQEEVQTFNTI